MKAKLFCIASLLALPLAAQTDLSSYQGPGVASPGAGNIGQASGQETDLRFYAGVTGIVSTNFQPLVTDAHGNLIHIPYLYGTSVSVGAYGSHGWQHAKLSLSYTGGYNYYANDTSYSGTNQALTLGYTAQFSSRLVFDARLSGFTLDQTTGTVTTAAAAQGQTAALPLFDSRVNAVNGTVSMTFMQSARTSYTISGGASDAIYSDGLTGYSGYNASASVMRRVSATTSVGAVYAYSDLSASDGSVTYESQSVSGRYVATFGPNWTLNVTAGATLSHVRQLVPIQLSPILALILGTPSVVVPYDYRNVYPTGNVSVNRRFQGLQHVSVSVGFTTSAGTTGNGLYGAVRSEAANGSLSYTGIRKWNFGLSGTYMNAANLGQYGGRVSFYGGGLGATYELMRYTHLVARFDTNHFEYGGFVGRRTTETATFGLSFSSKDIPLSLW